MIHDNSLILYGWIVFFFFNLLCICDIYHAFYIVRFQKLFTILSEKLFEGSSKKYLPKNLIKTICTKTSGKHFIIPFSVFTR